MTDNYAVESAILALITIVIIGFILKPVKTIICLSIIVSVSTAIYAGLKIKNPFGLLLPTTGVSIISITFVVLGKFTEVLDFMYEPEHINLGHLTLVRGTITMKGEIVIAILIFLFIFLFATLGEIPDDD